VDLKTRGLPGNTPRRPRSAGTNTITSSTWTGNIGDAPRVQVIDAQQAKPLLRDVLPAVIRDAIEAEIISDTKEGETL
jgi:hypothetical protein